MVMHNIFLHHKIQQAQREYPFLLRIQHDWYFLFVAKVFFANETFWNQNWHSFRSMMIDHWRWYSTTGRGYFWVTGKSARGALLQWCSPPLSIFTCRAVAWCFPPRSQCCLHGTFIPELRPCSCLPPFARPPWAVVYCGLSATLPFVPGTCPAA